MITVIVQDFNNFSQDFYDSVVNSLQLHRIRCSCGHSGCMVVHAYYERQIHSSDGSFTLRIQRLRCSECGRTHAVLLSSIVPYQQLPVEDQRLIVRAFDGHSGPMAVCTPQGAIDENNVKAVILRYRRHWRERLRAERIPLAPAAGLILRCFACYASQFLQVRRSANVLFADTT